MIDFGGRGQLESVLHCPEFSEFCSELKKKEDAGLLISLLGLINFSPGAGVSAVDLTKARRVFQADCTVYWPSLVCVPQTKQRIVNHVMCYFYLLLETIANFRVK